MLRFILPVLAAATAWAAGPVYELSGHVATSADHVRSARRGGLSRVPAHGIAWLFGATSPYTASTWIDVSGHFHFKKLLPGTYTLDISVRNKGEARQTVEVGPGTARRGRKVVLELNLKDSDFVFAADLRRFTVSVKQAELPTSAVRDYERAQKDLSKRDAESAVKHLEAAVERAPQFSAAWNNLGTIAYHNENYARAEECFREALEQDPQSFAALVNLGGVLVTEHKLDEGLARNVEAVALRDNDALAQSQLGMTYFLLGNLDLAKKHLERARELDPAHFSHPQLMLAEIDVRQGRPREAADVLDDFLVHHPDWPQAVRVRQTIAELRSR